MISGDCEIIEPLIIMDKKYNGYRMSAADAQRVAHQIAFAPIVFQVSHLSRAGHEESCPNPRGPSRKAKHFRKTDSGPVP